MAHEDHATQKNLSRSADFLETVISWAEAIVALILAVVIVIAVVSVAIATVRLFGQLPGSLGEDGFTKVIKAVLDTFIIIELFRITTAYVRHRDVIPTVLETALVVAAREIVVIEAGAAEPLAGAAVSATLVAIGVTWFLLRRGAPDIATPEDTDNL